MIRQKKWCIWPEIGRQGNQDADDLPSLVELQVPQLIVQTGKTKAIPFLTESLGLPIDVVNASVGDIFTDYTIIVGDDFAEYLKNPPTPVDPKSDKLQ